MGEQLFQAQTEQTIYLDSTVFQTSVVTFLRQLDSASIVLEGIQGAERFVRDMYIHSVLHMYPYRMLVNAARKLEGCVAIEIPNGTTTATLQVQQTGKLLKEPVPYHVWVQPQRVTKTQQLFLGIRLNRPARKYFHG